MDVIRGATVKGADHLRRIVDEAQTIVSETLAAPSGKHKGLTA